MRYRLKQAALVTAIAMLGYLALAIASDGSTFLEGLRRLSAPQWLALLCLSLLNYCLRFVRWHHYLLLLGARISLWRDLGIYFAGFAFTVTPGKAGEAVRSLYLRAAGVRWSTGLAALAVERLLDLAAVALLATLAMQSFANYAMPAAIVVVLGVGCLFIVTRPRIIHWLLLVLPKEGRVGSLAQGTVSILDESRIILAPYTLLTGLLLGITAWAAEAWGFYLLLQWLGNDIDLLLAMGIYAVSMLAGAISFLPGGLGGAEAAMAALLMTQGMSLSTAILATVICRAVTLWFAVLIGIGAMLTIKEH